MHPPPRVLGVVGHERSGDHEPARACELQLQRLVGSAGLGRDRVDEPHRRGQRQEERPEVRPGCFLEKRAASVGLLAHSQRGCSAFLKQLRCDPKQIRHVDSAVFTSQHHTDLLHRGV